MNNFLVKQYVIREWRTENANLTGTAGKAILVSVSLGRKLLNVVMVTYLPTLLMNIINQATNFITVENKVIHVTFPRPHCCSSLRSCSR